MHRKFSVYSYSLGSLFSNTSSKSMEDEIIKEIGKRHPDRR